MEHVANRGEHGAHPLDHAANVLGGRAALASRIGVKLAALGNWKLRGIPIERCLPIERATAGAVTRKDLRPDDWREIWPEAAQHDWRPVGAAEPVTAGEG